MPSECKGTETQTSFDHIGENQKQTVEKDSDKLSDSDWSNNKKHVNWFPYKSVIFKMKVQHTEQFVVKVSKLLLTMHSGQKADDPVGILKPSPANALQHLSCFSIDSFQNYFCHLKLHISSQMSSLDFIMPLCNHSFHSAMPQEACP